MLHHNFHVPAVQQPALEYQTMETQDSETKRSPGIGFTDRTDKSQQAEKSAKVVLVFRMFSDI